MAMQKRTISWFEYYSQHCFATGWKSIKGSFDIWVDLLSGNYKDYALLEEDCPYKECYDWFWYSLGEDCVYPKEFLEKLLTLVDAVDSGEEPCVDFPFSDWE